MTKQEFERWWADVTMRFPSIDTWLSKVAGDEISQRTLLKTWYDVLGGTPIADALEVNRLMQAGEVPWVGEYDSDKERLPQHVKRQCRQLAMDREVKPNREEFAPATSKTGGFHPGKILRRMQELIESGVTRDEARNIALAEFPVGQSPFRERRYNCPTCLDVGRITVASNEAIKAMMLGRFAECHHREGTMRCPCRGHIATKPNYQLATYDPAQDFKIEDFLWRDSRIGCYMTRRKSGIKPAC